ncbi:21025_t:CDS:2, partial [Racocetra persica]
KDIKADSYDNKWFAIKAFNNKEKKRQYEKMIEKLENIHITSDISHHSVSIRQYNRANDQYRIESGRNVAEYLEIIYNKFINEKSLFNVPEMSNIIEYITVSLYLNHLADFLCDDNNIINDDHEMLRPPDDSLRHIELKFYYEALVK